MAPSSPPARKVRDPNDIFKSIGPSTDDIAPASKSPTKEVATPSPRLKSIKRRLLNGNSFLRKGSSPPNGQRSPASRTWSKSRSKAERVGDIDLGEPLGQFDRGNVRERVRRWQAAGGGVVMEGDSVVPSPSHRNSTGKLVANYTTNDFDDLETSSARFGLEPLALPAPPFHDRPKRNSLPETSVTKEDGWEDVEPKRIASSPSRQEDWNSAPEDHDRPTVRRGQTRKRRRKRIVRESLVSSRTSGTRSPSPEISSTPVRLTDLIKDEEQANESATIISEVEGYKELPNMTPDVTLDEAKGILVPAFRSRSPSPPPPPAHALSTVTSLPLLMSSQSSVNSVPSLDHDGIRIKPTRKKSTKPERLERHRQRLKDREEILARERQRVRAEEVERIRQEERAREMERTKEIERIKEEERKRVLEEEKIREEERRKAREEEKLREEERRKMREFDRQLEKEREKERAARRQKDREREERRKRQEREKEREKERERERIRDEEHAKAQEVIRLEQERRRIRDEEVRRLRHEDEKHNEIMSEIQKANQHHHGNSRPKSRSKDQEVMCEVEKRISHVPLHDSIDMKDTIKQAVKEVMAEMFGEIIVEDIPRPQASFDKSATNSVLISSDHTRTTTDERGKSTRETTPEVEYHDNELQPILELHPVSKIQENLSKHSEVVDFSDDVDVFTLQSESEISFAMSEEPQGSPLRRRIGKNMSPTRPKRPERPRGNKSSESLRQRQKRGISPPEKFPQPDGRVSPSIVTEGDVEGPDDEDDQLKPMSVLSDETTRQADHLSSVDEQVAKPTLQRFTSHADLLSILSEDKRTQLKSVKSTDAKGKGASGMLTVDDLLGELVVEENIYQQELRILSDNVLPALLDMSVKALQVDVTGTLSRAISVVRRQNNFTPINDIGVILEHLRNVHNLIPYSHVDDLLEWAVNAHTIYEEYLRQWHMGYEEIFVEIDSPGGNGRKDKVDVAYLFKRPLVRCRLLAKLFKRINYLKPSDEAHKVFLSFQDLVVAARRKVAEEKARLEDEAAACIDASRALDLRNLEPCYGVVIHPEKRVRARDSFTMNLLHTLGRTLQLCVEVYLRDEGRKNKSYDAEILICQVEGKDTWLLFQPISVSHIIATQGTGEGELNLTISGTSPAGEKWSQILQFLGEPMIKMEWLHLLGASANEISKASKLQFPDAIKFEVPAEQNVQKFTTESILGEINAQMKDLHFTDSQNINKTYASTPPPPPPVSLPLSEPKKLKRSSTKKKKNPVNHPSRKPVAHVVVIPGVSDLYDGGSMICPLATELSLLHSAPPHFVKGQLIASPPASTIYPESSASYGAARTESRRLRHTNANAVRDITSVQITDGPQPPLRSPFTENPLLQSLQNSRSPPELSTKKSATLSFQITNSPPTSPGPVRSDLFSGEEESSADSDSSYDSSSGSASEDDSQVSSQPSHTQQFDHGNHVTDYSPMGPLGRRLLTPVQEEAESEINAPSVVVPKTKTPPPPPPAPVSLPPVTNNGPSKSNPRNDLKRRHSSPLKHEYAPSSASELTSDESTSETETSSGEDSTSEESSSGSSSEELSEVEDNTKPSTTVAPNVSHKSDENRAQIARKHSKKFSLTTPPPPPVSQSPVAFKSPAFVSIWGNNTWEKICPEECKLTIVGGQIGISVMRIGEDGFPAEGGKQLLVLDLNPMTTIRRGAALDLNIRLPATAKSPGSMIMFRSRTPLDCETLYNAINSARLSTGSLNRVGSVSRQGSVRGYRAIPSPSSSATFYPSEAPSIIGSDGTTFSSAISAIKGNIRNSIFRGGLSKSASGSWMSSSSTSSGLAGPRAIINPLGGIPITGIGGEAPYAGTGYISNLKIHLYKRESATKWADLGVARLNVITPPPGHKARGGSNLNSREKRVVVRDKKGYETLLDAVLGETCFERIARTGIAIHVPMEDDGYIPKEVMAGMGGRSAIYMLQFKSETETIETFRIIGKQGY